MSPWHLNPFSSPSWGSDSIHVNAASVVPLGEVPFNHEILREAYALCHCLPVLSTDKFKTDFYDVSVKPRTGRWGSHRHFCTQDLGPGCSLGMQRGTQSPWGTGSFCSLAAMQ